MKKINWIAGAALLAAAVTCDAQITGFDDLNYWGSGGNRSALVVDWNNGSSTETLAWGFLWSGPAPTVWDMMQVLAAADSRFFLRVDSLTGFGAAVFGIGYQWGSSPFGVAGAVDQFGNPVTPVFSGGINDMNTNPATTQAPTTSVNATAANAGDFYEEAWMDNGFWEFFDGTVGAAYPPTWTSNWLGVSGVNLVNDGWYALSISEPDYTSNLPGPAFAAIPEPSAALLVACGSGALILFRARKRLHAG